MINNTVVNNTLNNIPLFDISVKPPNNIGMKTKIIEDIIIQAKIMLKIFGISTMILPSFFSFCTSRSSFSFL